MMPSIGIIGKQNVGKSTLFNSLIKKNKSITYDSPGVTRDIVTEKVNWGEGRWELCDFPGFETSKNITDDEIGRAAIEKSLLEIENFNLLLWVVSRKGMNPFEHELKEKLRKINKPVWLLVNFIDDPALEAEASEFYSLGFSKVFFVSGLNNRNINKLREEIIGFFNGNQNLEETKSTLPIISLIGKPNVGKSTFFNTLLGKERSLVYDKPGTTRDTVEEKMIFQNGEVILQDTAGIRRKKLSFEALEVFSVARTKKSISGASVLLLLIDAREGFDKQNKAILEWVDNENKPLIVLINKTDLIDDEKREFITEDLKDLKKIFWDFPVYWISAITPKKSGKIVSEALRIVEEGKEKVSTPKLNDILEILNRNPVVGSHGLKFNYITQAYPEKRFIIFSNKATVPDNVKRYLRNNLLIQLQWKNIPLKIDFRKKRSGIPKFMEEEK
jgi:GTP-binding protein